MTDNAPKARGGRKTKYTPETVERIIEAVRMGATYKLACAYAGIGQSIFHHWMSTKPDFAAAVKEAEAAGSLELLKRIQREVENGAWQAAAWMLERRYPESYGRRVVQHQGDSENPIQIAHTWRDVVMQAYQKSAISDPSLPRLDANSNGDDDDGSWQD